ncbi:MAG: rod shape-determining protein RodA [Candidatus Ratteibacteria bacterium]|nr:rod shape-determining protein RodA [Candidatus Ratteibacteria bacterium]
MFKKTFKNFNWLLFSAALILSLIGILLIYSSTHGTIFSHQANLAFKQMLWLVVGFTALAAAYRSDYHVLISLAYPFYLITSLLLILVLLFGQTSWGAQRWLQIGGFALQPSEFCKISLILVLAYQLERQKGNLFRINSLALPTMALLLPMLLIFKQPDLGTAAVLFPIYLGMLYLAGVRSRHLVWIITSVLLLLPIFWFFLKDYQQARLLVFLKPNSDPLGTGYSIIQSKIAIGSGGLLGQGWLAGTQTHLHFLPEHHTDFIFSVLGEEWGFLGTSLILGLYAVLIVQGLKICFNARDSLGSLLAGGIVVFFITQIFINVGVTVGIMPATGIPLPFLSYGGSSLLASLFCIGILLNIQSKAFLF